MMSCWDVKGLGYLLLRRIIHFRDDFRAEKTFGFFVFFFKAFFIGDGSFCFFSAGRLVVVSVLFEAILLPCWN
jgi:hypothetical protein